MTELVVLNNVTQMRAWRRSGRRAVVMTMGALHPGHAALMDEARRVVGSEGQVVATVFVNPTQFSPGEDFESYPRTMKEDLEVCSGHGVDAVFSPDAVEVYGEEPSDLSVDPGELGSVLEGSIRPGHFRGVLTVVLKLLNLTQPDVAVFGEKDYQQLILVRRMVDAFNLPVEVVSVPTVRDPDGLAMSSRNVYLDSTQRAAAAAIPAALFVGRESAEAGSSGVDVVRAAEQVLNAQDGVEPDYVVLTGPHLEPAEDSGRARLLVAARVGETRLIDSTELVLAGAS
ncbi:MAG: pantoate--beta-alanine ligase [Candidatus Nanopelagicales bacterium]|nr:pantoate--beta-alanine ligase [Candidatus Nanopelagicales bacterium]MDZ4249720.1 pantoate--beta-alanine ligase [Candidatus Nanopelagicales bacterium]